MPERLYNRFARVTLDLFCDEGTFPIEIPQGQDVARTVQAFEALDCHVEAGARPNWIVVTCPSSVS